MASIIYFLCIITSGTAFVLSFWVELVSVDWIRLFLLACVCPGIVGFIRTLTAKKSGKDSSDTDQEHSLAYRCFVIALFPTSAAYIGLNVIRFALYFEMSRSFGDVVYFTFIISYVVLQLLYIIHHVKYYTKESLYTRIFALHVLGTDVLLWLHEFSIHSTRNLEFLLDKRFENFTSSRFSHFLDTVEPHIYPLVIQTMLVACGAVFQVWIDVGKLDSVLLNILFEEESIRKAAENEREREMNQVFLFPPAYEVRPPSSSSGDMSSNSQSSIKPDPPKRQFVSIGLIVGFLMFGGLVTICCLSMSPQNNPVLSKNVYLTFQVVLYITIYIACYAVLRSLNSPNNLDTSLITQHFNALTTMLLLSMFGYMLYAEFSIIAATGDPFDHHHVLELILSFLRMLHLCLQVITLIRSRRYRRHSVCLYKFVQCPYDSLLYLAFCNAGLWVVESIYDLRVPTASIIQMEYFGTDMWQAIRFCSFPLCTLFRFLSFIGFLEIILFE